MKTYAEIQSVEPIPSCVECGQDMYDEVYKTPLCTCCRQKFIKYPIPLSVKIFGSAIIMIMVFSLYSFSQNMNPGSPFQKGQWAVIHQSNRTAAVNYGDQVRSVLPEKENLGN